VTDTSVDSDSPPAQDARPEIKSWWTEGYQIGLEDTGNDGAAIICKGHGKPQTFGKIEYDPKQARHFITWNRDGCLALEQYKRDFWDSKFYYTMAEHVRSRS